MMILPLLLSLAAPAQDIVVRAATVQPVSGPAITDGVVVVRDGTIVAVGPASEIALPEGVQIIEGAVATPGLIDGFTVAGLSGPANAGHDQDHTERSLPIAPQLRALDGYNGHDRLVAYLLQHGITLIHSGPSPGAPIAGRSLLTKTVAAPAGSVALITDGMLVFTLGEPARHRGPNTRMGHAALLRQTLSEAREYQQRQALPLGDRPPIDLGMAALAEALAGERRVLFHAHRADDLLTAVRIADEFELDIVLAGAAEGYLVREELARAQIPVLVGPVMLRSWGDHTERSNASFENAALLAEAGVEIGFLSGYESYVPKVRVVLWEAAIAAAHGLGPERALRALTLGNATVLGVADRVGSLDVGKHGDVVVFDGDPFEHTSHACAVIIDGLVRSDRCH